MNKSDLSGVKKGDKLVLMGFTGIRLADVKVSAADKKSITVEKSDGSEMIFSRKDGVQTNVEEGKEKYANRILLPEDAPEQKDRTVRKDKKEVSKKDKKEVSKKDKKEDKKVSKKSEPEDEENDEDEDEDEEAPAPKKGKKEDKKEDKKAGKKDDKKSSKKSKKDEDEDDDDEYEEV